MSTHFAHGVSQVERIERVCDFLDSPAIQKAAHESVPVSMPPDPGSMGFDISLWMGLGVVGIWAALDAYAERAKMTKRRCDLCHSSGCLHARFKSPGKRPDKFAPVLGEVEDLRHLFAHNFAGLADAEYFKNRPRHLLRQDKNLTLPSGAEFTNGRVALRVIHLRHYASCAIEVLKAFG